MARKQDELVIKATLDTQEFDGSLDSMKREFAELEKKLGSSLLSPADQKAVLARMGTLKKGIDGFNLQIDALGRQSGFEQLAQTVTPLIGGFTAAAATLSLFGVENEKLNEIVQKTQALTIGLLALQDLSNLKNLKGLAALKVAKLKNFVVDKFTFTQTVKQVVAETSLTTAKGVGTIATNLATRAQVAWNAALAANPIGIIIVAIVALIAGIILLIKWLGNSENSFKLQKEAIDGTKFANDELLEAYNEHAKSIRKLDDEYKVIIGTMSDFEKSIKDIDDALGDSIKMIENEYIDKLNELSESQNSFWNLLWVGIKGSVIGSQYALLQYTKDYIDEYGNLLSEQNELIVKKVEIAEKEKFKIVKIEGIKMAALIKELDNKKNLAYEDGRRLAFKILSDSLKDEVNAYRKYQNEIIGLIKSTTDKQKDVDFQISIIDEDEYGKALANLSKESDDFADAHKILMKKLTDLPEAAQEELDGMTKKLGELKNRLVEIQDFDSLDELIIGAVKSTEDLNIEVEKTKQRVQQVTEEFVKIGKEAGIIGEDFGTWVSPMDKVVYSQEEILDLELKLLKSGKLRGDQVQLFSAVLAEQSEAQQNLIDNSVLSYELEQKKSQQLLTETELIKTISTLENDINVLAIENGVITQKEKDKMLLLNTAQQKLVNLKYLQLKAQKKINDAMRDANNAALLADLRAADQRRRTDEDAAKIGKFNMFDIKSTKDTEKAKLKIQKDNIANYYVEKIKQAKTGDEAQILGLQFEAEMDELDASFEGRWGNFEANVRDSIVDMSAMIASAVTDIFARDVTAKFDSLNARLADETEQAQSSLDKLRADDLISEQEYEDRSILVQEEAARKQKELKIKQFKAEKRLAMAQILIDTAAAVAKSWGQGGGLLGAPIAAVAAVSGAIQLGLVASQPVPEYAYGGKIGGSRHAFGGSMVEAEEGEFVVNRNTVAQPGVESLLTLMNSSGNNTAGDSNAGNGSTDPNIISQIVSETITGISSIPVVNVESDYTKVQRKVKSIESRSKW